MSVQAEAEAEKMRRVSGIVFADGATGRRARIAGTGLEVFEIIGTYLAIDRDWNELRATYHWLSEEQLRAALAYYAAYPDEIDERIERENAWTIEQVWEKYPFTRPSWR
jgi:uncharacterized protein (DUF433 family)